MPRSILAMRSWWRMTIAVMEIAPPTRIAMIGINSGPKPITESTNLMRRLLLRLRWLVFLDAVGMNPALNHCQSLLMREHHLDQLDDAPHHDSRNRHQPNAADG